jgi:NADH-quinone oxidoreductase subunit E
MTSAATTDNRASAYFPPFSVFPELEAEADGRISHYPESKRSAVLPLLHIVQHKFGFISPEAIDWVAVKLGLEPIKVLEVVTFYPGFRQYVPGKYHIRDGLCKEFGIDRSSADSHHHPISVSPCGKYSVEFAECLASCGTAPVCLVNDDFYEGVNVEMLQKACAE